MARAETVHLAKRVLVVDVELTENRTQITGLVAAETPELPEDAGPWVRSPPPSSSRSGHTQSVPTARPPSRRSRAPPIPASSSTTLRHRLNPGGHRRLNRALNTIVLTRTRTDPQTRAYINRRLTEDTTHKEIQRCLKRAIPGDRSSASSLPSTQHLERCHQQLDTT